MTKTYGAIRHCVFRPYMKGQGPIFHLWLFEGGTPRLDGKESVGYELQMSEHGIRSVVFEGDDIGVPAGQCIDSDATVRAIMRFLTLRPGDTDAAYFESWNSDQREYRDRHAEALAACVYDRFGS